MVRRAVSFRRLRELALVVVPLVVTAGFVALAAYALRQPAVSEKGEYSRSGSTEEIDGIPLRVRIFFRPLPQTMPGSEEDIPERIALGRRLYFERALSWTRSQSCNDCHRLDEGQAGVDHLPTSLGARGVRGTRNCPTVLNAGFQKVQFWDGRSPDLIEQAKDPLLNPSEMAMASEEDVVSRLAGSAEYRQAFRLAFPDQAEGVTFDNVARAIAAFERTLVSQARFDRYLAGQTDALTLQEKNGLLLFVDMHCVQCHNGILVGGRSLEKVGIYHSYWNQADVGRYGVTRREEDRFVFKVAMLRNVTLTAPYFFDGQVATLQEAVRLMAWMQLDTELDPADIDQIVCFLGTLEAQHLPVGPVSCLRDRLGGGQGQESVTRSEGARPSDLRCLAAGTAPWQGPDGPGARSCRPPRPPLALRPWIDPFD